MSKKSDLTAQLLDRIELSWPIPEPLEGVHLLGQGLFAVLLRSMDARKAEAAIRNLVSSYDDWNEVRVAQAQEIAAHLGLGARGVRVAEDVRTYLQEVFQNSHGVDLEFLREDASAAIKFVASLEFAGMGVGHYLLWLAGGREELPVTGHLVRVLDRVGLVTRTQSVRKARAALEPLIDKDRGLELVVKLGEVATRWCDPRKPVCHACVLVEDCRYGKKAFKEWKVQQERLEVQRKREEARLLALRKKEEERRLREETRARKKAEVEERKRQREAERKARAEAKNRAAEEARAARERAREEARRKKEQARAKAAGKRLADKKKAEAKAAARKAAAKKAAAKQAAAKKAAARKAAAARKKTSRKKATNKSTTRKPTRRPAAKKATRKKAARYRKK